VRIAIGNHIQNTVMKSSLTLCGLFLFSTRLHRKPSVFTSVVVKLCLWS